MLVVQNDFKNGKSSPKKTKAQQITHFDDYKIKKEYNRNEAFVSKQTDTT